MIDSTTIIIFICIMSIITIVFVIIISFINKWILELPKKFSNQNSEIKIVISEKMVYIEPLNQ
ncbi:MAG: hypothetical protein HRS50_01740, partial [Mycoplasmataceae bacterium]|nr:hypothetical protein [Mycoplasmataceae bacterium]